MSTGRQAQRNLSCRARPGRAGVVCSRAQDLAIVSRRPGGHSFALARRPTTGGRLALEEAISKGRRRPQRACSMTSALVAVDLDSAASARDKMGASPSGISASGYGS
jgi:hypothetical protein